MALESKETLKLGDIRAEVWIATREAENERQRLGLPSGIGSRARQVSGMMSKGMGL